MSDQINLIKQVLQHIETYENEVGNCDIREFSIYLKDKVLETTSANFSNNLDIADYKNFKVHPEVEFSTLLVQLYKFSKHYVKKVFQDKPWSSIDEYGFLASLLLTDSISKNELINMHMLEMSSGSEIFKRLLKNRLINEFPDENDKRAKRVSLTDEGRRHIISAFDEMYKVSQIIIGNLDENEIKEAIGIFNKLSIFHHHIHDFDKNSSVDELHEKYLFKVNM
ncbi:MAG: winged helix-turn-helix transcriptional regulator [Saprospiraceae bacterium]|nr:winged helix-turn-helix transcriptional regulator [Saprospiraceae bacterium]